ncbi:uncharacterized protein BKA78DRAFT_316925 [Phyllosticta capitalensis]
MPKPKAETINRALAIAAQLADAKTQHQATASSAPSALNHHNKTKFNADTIAMAQTQAQSQAPQRPPITCHVLDTTTGRPAAGLPVSLTLLSPSKSPGMAQLSATTNGDGRVATWTAAAAEATPGTTSLEALFGRGGDNNNNNATVKEDLVFALRFETQSYWESKGVAAFFPEVEVRFVVRARDEHYHVPLLLGPFNYTTYRGS